MASDGRKSAWKALQTLQGFAEDLVTKRAPNFVRQVQQSQAVLKELQHAVKVTVNVIAAVAPPPPTVAITSGRPVTKTSFPTAHRARKVVYAPDLDGRADPGEIVWTWVVHEEDPSQGKDRPVLVVGRDRSVLLGLMLSSQQRHGSERDWVGIGSGDWDYEGRESWVRLDRVLDVPEEGIRREGAILDRKLFDVVAARLRAEYAWR
jgi:PemK-like, MazF-like toxin of type II toxin-antitoxin system